MAMAVDMEAGDKREEPLNRARGELASCQTRDEKHLRR